MAIEGNRILCQNAVLFLTVDPIANFSQNGPRSDSLIGDKNYIIYDHKSMFLCAK
ncbi:hypothetical protein PALB_23200 [Pseudoalteromonas luteoviolacea B = ATCC 29581]|nr:hypothetical protein PALB_23200 [Pseudoalteromonas luteoviolacea B = ATCC 29581]